MLDAQPAGVTYVMSRAEKSPNARFFDAGLLLIKLSHLSRLIVLLYWLQR